MPTIPMTTTVMDDYERATILAFIELKLNLSLASFISPSSTLILMSFISWMVWKDELNWEYF